jgi:hypothetical protein
VEEVLGKVEEVLTMLAGSIELQVEVNKPKKSSPE